MQFVIFKGACSIGAIYIYEIFIHHELAFVSLIVYINYVMYIHTSSMQFNEIFWLYLEYALRKVNMLRRITFIDRVIRFIELF